jgi:hypothetical protein
MNDEHQIAQNSAHDEFYYPSAEIIAQANVKDPEAVRIEAAKGHPGVLGETGRRIGMVPEMGYGAG